MRPKLALLAVASILVAACGVWNQSVAPTPASGGVPDWAPRALHFVPFVATCQQSGSQCSGGRVQSLRKARPPISTGIDYPYALQYDASNNLYVANYVANTVTVYDATGNLTRTITSRISNPEALAFDDSSGTLYVADNCVVQSNCSNPNTVTGYVNGTYSFEITHLQQPRALAVDHDGNLYVANYGNNTVTEYTKRHALTRTIRGLHNPTALAISPNRELYVANSNGYDVTEYKPGATKPSRTIYVPQPYHLAVDSDGDLYVGTPSLVLEFCPFCNRPVRYINHVTVVALALDSSGNLYVANGGMAYATQNVQEYTRASITPSKTIPFSQTITAMAIAQ